MEEIVSSCLWKGFFELRAYALYIIHYGRYTTLEPIGVDPL